MKLMGQTSLTKIMNLIKSEFSKLATVAKSGSYNDLKDTPSIPNPSSSISSTLLPANWSGSGPYYYNLSASGVTTSSNGLISMSPNATGDQYEAAILANIRITSQSNNSIVLTATGIKPSINLPVVIILV